KKPLLKKRKWISFWKEYLVQDFGRSGHYRRRRIIFVRGIRRGPARGPPRPNERDQKLQRPRDLPTAEISRRRIAPYVGRESRTRAGYFMSDLDQNLRIYSGFLGGELRRVLGVTLLQERDE